MATYEIEVIRRGKIVVDDVEDLEQAEEYVENCNPIDEVKWSDFLETTPCSRELKKVCIPNLLTIKELAEKIDTKPAQIVSKLFLKGELVQLNSVINYDTALKIADDFDVMFQRME